MKILDGSKIWRTSTALALALSTLCVGLSACGQKGALYLPQDNTTVVSPEPLPDEHPPTLKDNAQNPNVDSNPIIDQPLPQDDKNAY